MSASSTINSGLTWRCLLFSKQQVKLSLTISLIVGSILNLINQGHLLMTPEKIDVLKLLLTYCVPYGVSTFSAAMSNLKQQKQLAQMGFDNNKKVTPAKFIDETNHYINKVDLRVLRDPSLHPKDLAAFLASFEAICALNESKKDTTSLDFAKDAINTGDLPKAFAIIKDVIEPFIAQSNQELVKLKSEVAIINSQQNQLLESLKKLSK